MSIEKWKTRVPLVVGAARAAWKIGAIERSEGSLGATLRRSRASRGLAFASDWTYASLLEWAASRFCHDEFVEHGETRASFNDINRSANRIARNLLRAGIEAGDGVAIMMGNRPAFLEAFFAIQKIGAYVVPVNTGLVGDGLTYILDHSEVRAAILDHRSAGIVAGVRSALERLDAFYVCIDGAPEGYALPESMADLADLRGGVAADGDNLGLHPDPEWPSLLLYTSGTTGPPKAVVTPYGKQGIKRLGLAAHFMYSRADKLYTCLPLFHANALMLTVLPALWVGIPIRIAERFSASGLWRELAECGATAFNTVGGMIPILLKTPPSPHDRRHRVRRVLSAACPADAWEPFEQRFGLTLWEGYGAVDGGGVAIMNLGNAPVGSLGRPAAGMRFRLVSDDEDVAVGDPGELIVFVGAQEGSKVRYFKDEAASRDKVRDGWLYTGDLMRSDEAGFLYFVGRNTDSMRRRGENVSAYEVEKQVDAHPDVLESAAFGVPSELGEEEIMVCVTPVEGRSVSPADLKRFLDERLPRYAIPSYLEVVDALPKTGTHRVMKRALKERGVTAHTVRLDAR